MTRKDGQKLKAGDKVFRINHYARGGQKSMIPVTVVSVRSKYVYITKSPNHQKVKGIIKKDRPIQCAEYLYGNREILDCVAYSDIERTRNDAVLNTLGYRVVLSRYIVGVYKGKVSLR